MDQLKVLSRYIGSNAAAGLTVLVVLGALSPEQSATIVAAMHQVYNDLHDIAGALSKIWIIVFPLISVWLAKMGLNSSQVGAMVTNLLNRASGNTPAATDVKTAIVNAASSLPEVQKVVAPELAPIPATSPKVTTT